MIVGGLPGEPTVTSQVVEQLLVRKWKQHTSPAAHVLGPEHASVVPGQPSLGGAQ